MVRPRRKLLSRDHLGMEVSMDEVRIEKQEAVFLMMSEAGTTEGVIPCDRCGGNGSEGDGLVVCRKCGGHGLMRRRVTVVVEDKVLGKE